MERRDLQIFFVTIASRNEILVQFVLFNFLEIMSRVSLLKTKCTTYYFLETEYMYYDTKRDQVKHPSVSIETCVPITID